MKEKKDGNGLAKKLDAIVGPDIRRFSDLTHAFEETALGIEIHSDKTEGLAADFHRDLKTAREEIEVKRKNAVGPLEFLLRSVNEVYRTALDRIDSVEKNLKGKILEYRKYVEEERRRENERRIAEHEKKVEEEKKRYIEREGGDPADYIPPPPPAPLISRDNTARGSSGTVSVRERWTFEVYDAEKIPVAFKVVHRPLITAEINRLVKSGMNPEGKIPGVRIYKEKSVASR